VGESSFDSASGPRPNFLVGDLVGDLLGVLWAFS